MGGDNFQKSPVKEDGQSQPPRSKIYQHSVGRKLRNIISSAQSKTVDNMDAAIEAWFLNYVVPAVQTAALRSEMKCSIPIPGIFYEDQPENIFLPPFSYQMYLDRHIKRIQDEDVNAELVKWPPPPISPTNCCTNPQYVPGRPNCSLCRNVYMKTEVERGSIVISW